MLDDNALKFTLESLPDEFLSQNNVTSFLLVTDWLEMGETSEKKLAYKKFNNDDVQILLIQKFTDSDGKRLVPPKEPLTEQEYRQLLEHSIQRIEKKRHEFNYVQNGITFSMKYDAFADSNLRILEVDAQNEAERDAFVADKFPYDLADVTGQIDYYGYRIAQVLSQ